MELETKLNSIQDYVSMIMKKSPIGLYVPKDRFAVSGDAEPDERHIAYMLDDQEQVVSSPKQWMQDI